MDGDRISTAAEREERILARRRRIQERISAKLKGEGGVSKKENIEKKETSKGKQQILESRKRLYRLKLDGNDVVTNIRVVNDNRENLRQIDEEQQRQTLRAELLAEAEKSARENASISLSWGELYKFNVPQDLYKEIQAVKDSTQSVIDSKDDLLSGLKAELKQKDDEYSKTLKRYAEDVDLLISNMGASSASSRAPTRRSSKRLRTPSSWSARTWWRTTSRRCCICSRSGTRWSSTTWRRRRSARNSTSSSWRSCGRPTRRTTTS